MARAPRSAPRSCDYDPTSQVLLSSDESEIAWLLQEWVVTSHHGSLHVPISSTARGSKSTWLCYSSVTLLVLDPPVSSQIEAPTVTAATYMNPILDCVGVGLWVSLYGDYYYTTKTISRSCRVKF